jgi:4-amino-4-deoxy-L-arabinose transferase-like glycosyltransferase
MKKSTRLPRKERIKAFFVKEKFLIAILFVASLLRFPFLNHHMDTLYGDEIAIGYNAFSITQTLRDEFGRFLPLQFESWGDQKNPVYIYATALTQLVTGPTMASVRLPSAIAGVIAVYLTYELVVLLGLGEGVGYISALLLALTPWHIHISRGGYEANVALTLGLASVILLLKKKYIPSALLLALSAYTYYTTKMFAPLLLGLTWIYLIDWNAWRKSIKPFVWYWGSALIAVVPIIYLALFAGGQIRFQSINIFVDKTVTPRVERARNFFPDSKSLMAKIDENRLTYHAFDFLTYYFENFSGQFLFVNGDSNVRYGINGHGMLYLIDAPLILAGIILMRDKHRKTWKYLLVWLLLAPIPTALVGRAYGLRSLAVLPIPQIFAAYALYCLYQWSSVVRIRKVFLYLTSIIYLLSVANWLVRYAYQYPSYGRYWYDAAMQDAITYAKEREGKYDNFIISQSYGEVSMYYAFFNRIQPDVYRQAKANRLIVDGVPMIKLGNYYFGDIRPKGPIENMDLPHNTLILVQPYFEYGEDSILARDDGRPIYRVFQFPTVLMQAKEKAAPAQ